MLVSLDTGFFDRDPSEVAPDLLGKIVVSRVDGVETGGVIVESEAYLGADDPGSHASAKGITARNAVMYGPPATAYVYFTYGCHHMLNLVCQPEGTAGAVLIRALEPSIGVDVMIRRRMGRAGTELASGPGKLAQALGVDLSDNGSALGAGRITVYDAAPIAPNVISTSGRIGLSAGQNPLLRFYVAGSAHVSRCARSSSGRGDQRGIDAGGPKGRGTNEVR